MNAARTGRLAEVTGSRAMCGVGSSSFDSGLEIYREDHLNSLMHAVYQYGWEEHVYPAEVALVTIEAKTAESCGWMNLSVGSCIAIELGISD